MTIVEVKHTVAKMMGERTLRKLTDSQKETLSGIELRALRNETPEAIEALMGAIVTTCLQFIGQHEQAEILSEAKRVLNAEYAGLNKFDEMTSFLARNYKDNVIVKESTNIFVDLEYVRALAILKLAGKNIRPYCPKGYAESNESYIAACL